MGFVKTERIRGIIGKEIKEVRRSGLLSLIILLPLLLLLLPQPSLHPQPIAVVGEGENSLSELSSFDVYFVATKEEALKMLKSGEVLAIISFEAKQTKIFAEESFYGLRTVNTIQAALSEVEISHIQPSQFQPKSLLLLAFIAQMGALVLASLSISVERETGTLELLSLRTSAFEIVFGKLCAIMLISLIPLLVGFGVLHSTFGILYSANTAFETVLRLLLLLIASSSIGMVFSTVLSKENSILLAMIFLLANGIAALNPSPEFFIYIFPLVQIRYGYLESIPYSLTAFILSIVVFKVRRERNRIRG
jgi:ABC-type transport system involved in multi-copper enzyme maturation permease subunit